MDRPDFENLYNPQNRCTVTYKNSYGETLKGLLLDSVKVGHNGVEFVYVNNFATRIPLSSVIGVKDTGNAWSK